MTLRKPNLFWMLALSLLLSGVVFSEPLQVRHVEGVTFGFLTLRNLDGQIIADGYFKQVAKPGDPVITDDVQFHFKDGSVYREITKFTQRGTFRLVSNQVAQKGPSFKQESESLIDVTGGKITVRTVEHGQEKSETKQLNIPPDVSNGLLFVLVKNMDPTTETTLSLVAISSKPRIVQLKFRPAEEKTVKFGLFTFKAQHYVMKIKIEGAAGKIAPLIGKQPPEVHLWTMKSESPSFLEFEGPLYADGPVWRIELGAPDMGTRENKAEQKASSAD
jgi:hypothetical protein